MEIILLLIPAALMISGVGLVIFRWSVRSGQFDDMDGAAHRIIMDDDDPLLPQKPVVTDSTTDNLKHSKRPDAAENH